MHGPGGPCFGPNSRTHNIADRSLRRVTPDEPSVTLNRIFIGLLQPLLALLLITGMAQAEPYLLDNDTRARVVERSAEAGGVFAAQADHDSGLELIAAEFTDGDFGPGHALLPDHAEIALDLARLIEIGCAAYPTAPPSHRPCAAPSTGPPLV